MPTNDHTSVTVASLPPCDICTQAGRNTVATVDGATTMGPWANMCEDHFAAVGVGLGLGRGQRLVHAVTLDEVR